MPHKTLIFFALILATVVAVAGTVSFYMQRSTSSIADIEAQQSIRLGQTIASQMRSGDLTGALQRYESIVSSATATPRVIASSILTGSGIRYALTKNPSDAVQSVLDLKKVAASSDVRPFIHASAVFLIAQFYGYAAYDESVFQEIFKDDPYRQYLVTVDGQMDKLSSIRKLYLYSYQIVPTFPAAIAIADVDMTRKYRDVALGYTEPENKSKIDNVEKFLALAEDLTRSSIYEQPSEPGAYGTYLLKRAYVIGGLAHFKGAPYNTQYKKAFEDVIAYFTEHSGAQVEKTVAIARVKYAMYLVQIDNDVSAARAELLQAIAAVRASQDPLNDTLVNFIHYIKQAPLVYEIPMAIENMTKISPEFKGFVESIK
ncbi:MAG: hypothetical protein Q8R25_04860 [bacterium]|nr:hypothetical protein [bacterium]